jgi:hypothetical protein
LIGVDLISDALPFGRLWYAGPNAVANAIGYAKHCSRSHDAVIRVYDESGNVIEMHRSAVDGRRQNRRVSAPFPERSAALLIAEDHLGRRFAHIKQGAHLLDLRALRRRVRKGQYRDDKRENQSGADNVSYSNIATF